MDNIQTDQAQSNTNSNNTTTKSSWPIDPATVISEWGLSKMTKEEQIDAIERIGRLIFQAIMVRSLDILTEEEQNELDLLLDKDDTNPDTVLLFLADKIPTFEIIRQEEIAKLKKDIIVQ